MNEVKITYETLFDLLRREKSREELQELDSTFYDDVVSYLHNKQAILKEDGLQSALFQASESEKVRVQIQNVKKMLKELYERRQLKVIRFAINRSKTSSGITNTIAMLPEEKKFFEEILSLFEVDRKEVLGRILFFENSTPARPVMENKKSEEKKEPRAQEPKDAATDGDESDDDEEDDDDDTREEESVIDNYEERIKVKFKQKVSKFIGKNMELYGPYEPGDEAEVPKIIANILLTKGHAEEA